MRYILPIGTQKLFLVPLMPKLEDYKGTTCDNCPQFTTYVVSLVNHKLKQHIEMGLCDDCTNVLVKNFPEGVYEMVLHNLINGAPYIYHLHVDPKPM